MDGRSASAAAAAAFVDASRPTVRAASSADHEAEITRDCEEEAFAYRDSRPDFYRFALKDAKKYLQEELKLVRESHFGPGQFRVETLIGSTQSGILIPKATARIHSECSKKRNSLLATKKDAQPPNSRQARGIAILAYKTARRAVMEETKRSARAQERRRRDRKAYVTH
jgi:hypothetical protein